MATRPTQYCAKCGEYIKLDWVCVWSNQTWNTVQKLVHIDGNGTIIHRAHAPVPEKES